MKLATRKIIILYAVCITAVGCGKLVERKSPTAVQTEFGISVQDTKIEFNPRIKGLKSYLTKTSFSFPSSSVLELSNVLLRSSKKEFVEAGLRVSQLTSDPGVTATAMTAVVSPPQNPYGEQAYSFLNPLLLTQYTDLLNKAENRVAEVAGNLPNTITGQPATAADYLSIIIDRLSQFATNLTPQVGAPEGKFLLPVIDIIKNDYIAPLTQTLPRLTWNGVQRLDVFLESLKKEILNMPGMSSDEKTASIAQLVEAFDYAKQAEDAVSSDLALQLVVDMWLNKSNRSRLSPEIASTLKPFSEKVLLALATDNKALFSEAAWNEFKNNKDYSSMNETQLVALMTKNTGVLKPEEWGALNADQLRKMILKSEAIQNLITSQHSNPGADDQDKLRIFLAYWLNIKTRFVFPNALINAFSDLSDNDLLMIRNYTYGELITTKTNLALIKYNITKKIESYSEETENVENPPKIEGSGVSNFRRTITKRIYSRVDAALKDKILKLVVNLKDLVKNKIIEQLTQQKTKFNTMAFDNFKQYAEQYLNTWFFDKKSLPLFETVFFSAERLAQNIWNVTGSTSESSSQVIGLGLSNNYLQVMSAPNKSEVAGFKIVSKLAAMAGYRDYSNNLTDAPTMSLTAGKEDERLDVMAKNMTPTSEAVFAVPDHVYFKTAYKADLEKSRHNYQVSVLGQMSLLKGYVDAMKYTKPWMPSPYENTIGKLRIVGLSKELEAKEIFNKTLNFKQSLILAAYLLESMKAKMVAVLDEHGNLYEGVNSLPNPVGVVLLDYNRDQMIHTAKTLDIATAIEALCDFWTVTSDLEKIGDDPQLTAEKIKQLQDARLEVRKLISGLAIFSAGHLMMPDGGFIESLNLDTHKALSVKRNLRDQLAMQKALISATTIIDSDLLRAKLLDNYFFLNSHMWNEKLGFYSVSEGATEPVVYLDNILTFIENLDVLKSLAAQMQSKHPGLSTSLDQMNALGRYLMARHLSIATFNQQPMDLVLPQEVLLGQ